MQIEEKEIDGSIAADGTVTFTDSAPVFSKKDVEDMLRNAQEQAAGLADLDHRWFSCVSSLSLRSLLQPKLACREKRATTTTTIPRVRNNAEIHTAGWDIRKEKCR